MQNGTFMPKICGFTESRHNGLREVKFELKKNDGKHALNVMKSVKQVPILQSQCIGKPVHV